MLVVDASALTELLRRPAGEAVSSALRDHDFDLHAPHLVDVEVLSALRRVVAAGDASAARGAEAVADLRDLPLQRYPHEPLVPRIWQLRESFSAYDSAYVALAEVVSDAGAPLLTADTRLARAASAHASVEVVPRRLTFSSAGSCSPVRRVARGERSRRAWTRAPSAAEARSAPVRTRGIGPRGAADPKPRRRRVADPTGTRRSDPDDGA